MAGRPSKPPQSKEEMVGAARQKRNGRLYTGRPGTVEVNDRKISETVTIAAAGLQNLTDPMRRVPLSDTATLQQITMQYLSVCAEVSIIPTVLGLAQALGHSRRSLYTFMSDQPEHPSTQFLRSYTDTCAEIVMQTALTGSVQQIAAIFNLKSRYKWSDSGADVPKDQIESPALSAEAIMEKYGDLPE